MNLPGYDEWKTRSPYDDISPLDEARAEIEDQNRIIDLLVSVLEDCANYFEGSGESPEQLEQLEVNLAAKIKGALNTL
jgi:hypothetical protein